MFRSDLQGRILSTVFLRPDDRHSISDLVRMTDSSIPSVLRAAERAQAAKLVSVEKSGGAKFVRSNNRAVCSPQCFTNQT